MLLTIDTLETDFIDLISFEKHMLTDDMQNNYIPNHNGNDLCYGELISYLFKHALASIQNKYELPFPINTLDVIKTQDQIAMVLYDYVDSLMIKD